MIQIKQIRKATGTAGFSLCRVTLITGLFVLASCASTPQPPTQALQAAEQAITTAERARVADYASLELNEARENLTAANNAVLANEMVVAERLAERSQVNAELASARTAMLKAKEVNDDMQESIDTLKVEMQRNTGAR